MDVYVPPGQSRSFEMPKVAGQDTLVLGGDEADFDNRAFALTPPREQIEILFVGNDVETDVQQLLFCLRGLQSGM